MHPLELLRFCPKCGSNNFSISSDNSKKCQDCGFEFFKNPVPGVGAIIFDSKNRLLCEKRAKEPAKGALALPGGFVDLGETLEQALIREVKEELGLDIEIVRFVANIPNHYIYQGMDSMPLDFFFECKLKDENDLTHIRKQKGEVSDILFIDRDKINPDDFGLESSRTLFKKYF